MKRFHYIPVAEQSPIRIHVENGSGVVQRGLVRGACTKKEAEVLERFLLALACAGVDLNDSKFEVAMTTTLDALANA
jgi:hypothetical protein